MHYLLIIGIFLSFFLQFLLFSKKGRTAADTVLAVWMFIFGIHLFGFYLYSLGYWQEYPHMMGLMIPLPLLHGPMLFLYILYSLRPDQPFNHRVYLHFLPAIIIVLLLTEFYFFFTAEQKLMVDRGEIQRYNVLGNVILISYIVSGLTYPVVSYRMLGRYTSMLRENFAYEETINLNWLRYCIFGIGVVYVVAAVVSVMREGMGMDLGINADMVIYFFCVLFIFLLGFFGIRQQGIFTDAGLNASELVEPRQTAEYRRSGLKDAEAARYHKVLIDLMHHKKPYLEPKLTIISLSGELGISVNYLSQVINQYEGKNFYDFVNEYRVNEFKKRAADPANKNFSILAIAYDSGFNSKSAFNQVFKKITGKTPSEFIRG